MKVRRVFRWLGDLINPIVVKELRQAVQSKFLVICLMMFFVFEIVGLSIFIIASDATQTFNADSWEGGRTAFMVLQYILLATCLLFLPINAGVRLASERSDVNVDLMYITTLSPRKIITGKMAAALLLALMIFSACMPYMVFTYFLRGIDLPIIVLVLVIDFCVVVAAVQLCIFLAAVSRNRILKAFLGLLGLLALIGIYYYTMMGTTYLVAYMPAATWRDREFWLILLGLSASLFVLVGLLYVWSIALISPPSSNRTVGTRVFVLVTWVLGAAITGYWSYHEHTTGSPSHLVEVPIFLWLFTSYLLTALTLFMAFNEREEWGPRVARTIPRNRLLRLPAFFLYCGSAGGVLFTTLLFTLTSAAALFWDQYLLSSSFSPRYRGQLEMLVVVRVNAMIFLYLYCYGMTSILLRRTLFRSIPNIFTWLIIVLLLVILCLIPYFTSYVVWSYRGNGRFWNYEQNYYWLLGHPWYAAYEMSSLNPYSNNQRTFVYLAVVLMWAGLITLLNLPWLVKQIRNFRTFEAEPAPQPALPLVHGLSMESAS